MTSTDTASANAAPEFRAAATDLSERLRSGVSKGPVIDLVPDDASGVSFAADGAATIGAFATIETIAQHAELTQSYPGLTATAAGLATPQIRHLATLAGNLAQRSRCWYYRNPHIGCLKKGGEDCPARSGNHLYHVAFDTGPCIAPHPSSMAVALLAYEATVTTDRRTGVSIPDLLGDGSDGSRDHALGRGEIIQSITLPAPVIAERALYKRAISRAYAEWPLVEICARAVVADGRFRFIRLAAGGVAPRPLRLVASEALLLGAEANDETILEAARRATRDASPLPMTEYKLDLLTGLVNDLLERLAG
jgi:xanthine dehydrogenase YagS FAD-binding subunit